MYEQTFTQSTLHYLRVAFLWILVSFYSFSSACTTAVISGKFTASGRPMLWKVRDTEAYENVMKRYTAHQWEYVGLVNTTDTLGVQIWGGWNEKGFAIMNSASFNVNAGYKRDFIDQEGFFMHQALKECKTIADFENLLNARPKPMGLAAHFGVIDAEGGAAFYEVNNETWTKFDANDEKVAPRGYVLRTNYSQTGKEGEGLGFIRCQTAHLLFNEVSVGELRIETLMQDFSRSTVHPVLKADYRKTYSKLPAKGVMVTSDDLICRYGTSSTIAIEGVNARKNEKPVHTTGWVQIGLPFVSVTLPMWCGVELPQGLVAPAMGAESAFSAKSMELKKQIFPLWAQSDGYHYLAIDKLFNADKTGYTQRIEAVEKDIFSIAEQARQVWRSEKTVPDEWKSERIVAYLNDLVSAFYAELK